MASHVIFKTTVGSRRTVKGEDNIEMNDPVNRDRGGWSVWTSHQTWAWEVCGEDVSTPHGESEFVF